MVALEFGAAFGVAAAGTFGFYPALRLERRKRLAALCGLNALILLSPLLVAPEHRAVRCLSAIVAVVAFVKLYDLHRHVECHKPPPFRTYVAFLINAFSHVLRRLDIEPRPSFRTDCRRLVVGLLASVAGLRVLVATFQIDWTIHPFLLEHVAKVIALYLAMVPLGVFGSSAWRLLGGRGLEIMENPFASRTPADFWRRYNRPVTQFLFEDVFKPSGGIRAPVRGTLLVFVLSGIIHEYVFDMGASRVQGYQMAFFLIQGCGVAASLSVRPRGWRVVPWMIGTYAFMLTTSVLFFASVAEVLPFYQSGGLVARVRSW